MAQNESNSSGFALPAPTDSAVAPAADAGTQASSAVAVNPGMPGVDTSSRDLLIGGAILVALLVAFFFAKNAYANALVSKRVPPNKANSAAWWLFVFLASLSTGVVLSIVSASRFMTPLVLGPLAAIGLVGLVLALMMGRK
ncbi:MAG: hypothetical protein ABWY08_04535 [Comamonas sp.]